MEMNRRPLYNSLRMNWVLDPSVDVEPWQVEDYRSIPLDTLFERLEDSSLHLDKISFKVFGETVDSPEELTDALLADASLNTKAQDQVYLVIFELWRRLLPEKPCLSVFCDEVDHQIYLYDRQQVLNGEDIQDALANLQVLLDENVDDGADPHEAFEFLEAGCANDIESFLHDFIADQIDNGNYSYAKELIEGFGSYVSDENWFEFLRASALSTTDPREANAIIKRLIEDKKRIPDIELHLEILSYMVRNGDEETFAKLVRNTLDLLRTEEDFQSLVAVCIDFFHRLDRESIENALQTMLEKRSDLNLDASFNKKDRDFAQFSKIFVS